MLKMVGVCDQCQAEFNYGGSAWRFNGEFWEHKCSHMHPQAGHCGVFVHQHIYEKIIGLEQQIKELEISVIKTQNKSDIWKCELCGEEFDIYSGWGSIAQWDISGVPSRHNCKDGGRGKLVK